MSDPIVIPIPMAAKKYCVDVKRLRGAVFTSRNLQPIGDFKLDVVQDDETLQRWVAKQKAASHG